MYANQALVRERDHPHLWEYTQTRTLLTIFCRYNSCLLGQITNNLSMSNAFRFVVVTLCHGSLYSSSLHCPITSSLSSPNRLDLSDLYSSTRLHVSSTFVATAPTRCVCFPLTPTDYQAVRQRRVHPGLNKLWFSGELCGVMSSTGKGNCRLKQIIP